MTVMDIAMTMTNSDFLAEVLGPLEVDEYAWVCSFAASPEEGQWGGRSYRGTPAQAGLIDRAADHNTYFCTAILSGFHEGKWARTKATFRRLACLVVDDVDPESILGSFTWAIQTSPGKWQIGFSLDAADPDSQNLELIDRLMAALSARGKLGGNDTSGNAAVRYVRLPVGTNTKARAAGPWQHQLAMWNPKVRWTLEDAASAVSIDLDTLRQRIVLDAPARKDGPPASVDALQTLTAPLNERSYHDSIVRLAASLVAGGMFPGAAVEHLYALMDLIKPEGPADEVYRWEVRRAEIPRAVKSAEKFAPENRQPPAVTITLNKAAKPPPSDLEPLDWTVLEVTEPEPADFMLQGWLPRRTTTLLAANGGVGKSNLSLQLAVSLAHGLPFLGLDTQGCKVMVVSAEDEARTVHFRVANICAAAGVAMGSLQDRMVVYDLAQADCVMWKNGYPTSRMQWLSDTIQRHDVDAVILDNASDVFADNENDRTAVRGFMRCLNLIANGHDCAVLLLSHVDKASVRVGAGNDTDSTFSGSTAWNNSVRSRWAMIKGEGDAVLLKHEKCNLGPLQQAIELEFDPAAKVFRVFGTVPGANAARAMLRETQRIAIMRLLAAAVDEDINISLRDKASNTAFKVLRSRPGFPARLKPEQSQEIMQGLALAGLISEVQYKMKNGSRSMRVELTDDGRRMLALKGGT